jgi:predicted PurR-regulated permease PerM
MESKIYSTIVITSSTIILISAFLIVIAGISTTTFVNVIAQGEGGANQTMQQQQEDPEHSANRTMEKAIQSANETGEDVGKVGSKITEGAKDLVGNIGEKLQDLGK